ncbi:GNAT family N-acetyltransferase [Salibacterium salarium]|uniref:GNAT family N-acetyltransferase n=1 Tax=Salibacterium salarium TaxID=284579 RepID=A0A428MXI6_9BACI|nr:GNAT family N-acetyltransferase [Salibacterium salarium]RSL30806.1 GNAT family N-acetyltransferase [Salibacterium salarium]
MVQVQEVLNQQQKNDAFYVRFEVFVKEQKVPESLEIDEHDETAIHFIAYDRNTPVGAGRLRFVNDYGKVERICVIGSARHTGTGQHIMQAIEEKSLHEGYRAMKLNAQFSAAGFYKKLGYTVTSDEFMDAGIPHVEMKKNIFTSTNSSL